MNIKKYLNDWRLVLLLCLTWGLIPFYPEPYIWGKLKWIYGGAVDMGWIDWTNFVLHALPWALLGRIGLQKLP